MSPKLIWSFNPYRFLYGVFLFETLRGNERMVLKCVENVAFKPHTLNISFNEHVDCLVRKGMLLEEIF